LLRHIRFDEVFVLQGTPLMASSFDWNNHGGKLKRSCCFFSAVILLVAHVFTIERRADGRTRVLEISAS